MDLPAASSVATVIIAGGTILGGVVYAIRQFARLANSINAMMEGYGKIDMLEQKINRLEPKVDTIWEFAMRRGAVEAIQRGIATMNSPVVISEEAKTWMQTLAAPLREAYETEWKDLPDTDLAMEIERRFGDQIVRQVCLPHGISNGVCLLIACAVAKGG